MQKKVVLVKKSVGDKVVTTTKILFLKNKKILVYSHIAAGKKYFLLCEKKVVVKKIVVKKIVVKTLHKLLKAS